MNCKVCGNVIEEQATFCTSCGAKVEEAVDTAAVTEDKLIADVVADANVKTEDEKLDDMMNEADKMVELEEEPFVSEQAVVREEAVIREKQSFVEKSVEDTHVYTSDSRQVDETPVEVPVVPVTMSKMESRQEKKARKKAEKLLEKSKYKISRNSVMVTIFSVLLAIMFTGVLFSATSIFMLAHEAFDEFYKKVVFTDLIANIDFWVLTSSWYAIAVYTILILLVLLILFVLRRRKYAILNYVGIPAIINGLVFLLIGYFSNWFSSLFSLRDTMKELFDTIHGPAQDIIVWYALVLLVVGVAAVLLYAIISAIHKAVYRRKCRKAAAK